MEDYQKYLLSQDILLSLILSVLLLMFVVSLCILKKHEKWNQIFRRWNGENTN